MRKCHVTSSRAQHGEGSAGKCLVGCGSKTEAAAPVAVARGDEAGDCERGLYRHSGFPPAAAGKNSNRTERRLPANQSEGQTWMGPRRARKNPHPLAEHCSQLRCELGVPAK